MPLLHRRRFLRGLAGTLASMGAQRLLAAPAGRGSLFLNAVGGSLTSHSLDPATANLGVRDRLDLGNNIEFGWQHPTANILYLASSLSLNEPPYLLHSVGFSAEGELRLLGDGVRMPSRANYLTVDRSGCFILTSHPHPSELGVHRIRPDMTIGDRVEQSSDLNFGFYGHQTRVSLSGRTAILVTRGEDAGNGMREKPGALRQFDFREGRLSPRAVIAPGKGYGFGPRDIDFHPNGGWLFAALERQNSLAVFRMSGDDIDPEPRFIGSTLPAGYPHVPGQLSGDLHVHPDGRSVYVANRGNLWVPCKSGENSIAHFSLDDGAGSPVFRGVADTQRFHPRTFAVDPTGNVLIAASVRGYQEVESGRLVTRPPALTAYAIAADGSLRIRSVKDLGGTAAAQQYWCDFALAIPEWRSRRGT
jgi:6-phosphogluconolactonase